MSPPLAQALILGNPAHGQKIAQALRGAGFDCQLGPDGDDLSRLKQHLQAFAEKAGRSSSLFAHLVHPGDGFWVERPELGVVCQQLGLAALTPSAKCITLFSNPLQLLEFAESRGVPHLVASFEPVQSLREILGVVKGSGIQFPIVLKNIRRESGIGILVVKSEEELALRLPRWIEELREGAGEATLFVEKYVEAARYIEVPFVRFKDGRVRVLPRVDASLQLRARRYVDLCPAENLDTRLERHFDACVRKISKDSGFVGVGTLEFLCEGGNAWLVGGRAGLSSSFPLWEKVGGLCAVSLQLAAFGVLPAEAAIERDEVRGGALARIFAEDPLLEVPRPGRVIEVNSSAQWTFATGSVETSIAVTQGQEVALESDGFLGFVLGTAETVKGAVNSLGLCLSSAESPVWISGTLQTNEKYLSEILLHPWVREGFFHTAFLDEEFVPNRELPMEMLKGVAGALELGEGPWVLADRIKLKQASDLQKDAWTWLEGGPRSGWLKGPSLERLRVAVEATSMGSWHVRAGNAFFSIRPLDSPRTDRNRPLKAVTSGVVRGLRYKVGKVVPPGEPMVYVRSLRRIVSHSVGRKVRLSRWEVKPGQKIETGTVLGWVELLD
jgi:acetyl-CoA carboxylase biotin carboxylase subunit